LRLVSDVDRQWQRISPCLLDLVGGGIDSAGKLWVGLGRLGRDCDVRPIVGRLQPNRKSYAARSARYINKVLPDKVEVMIVLLVATPRP
jgi:hypothetical protein